MNLKEQSEVEDDYEKLKKGKDIGGYYFNVVEELNDFNEWCISEKSFWGIPIPYFINKHSKKVFVNQETVLHVAKIFREHGSDAWYDLSIKELLPDAYKHQANDLIKGDEVFDVWFDNSLTWKTILLDQVHYDDKINEFENSLDNVLSTQHKDYKTQAQILEEYEKLTAQEQKGRGRRSVSKAFKAKQEREELLESYSAQRNHYLSQLDISTFQSLVPSSTYRSESEIKSLIGIFSLTHRRKT